MASIAKLVGAKETNTDSEELLDVMIGESHKGRESLVIEANTKTALRKGEWLMIPPYDGPAKNKWVNIELGNSNHYQLYNLAKDIGQQINLAENEPVKLKEMIESYKLLRGDLNLKTQELELK
nr:hypothetical protein [Carboxylicivirga marina]